MGHSRAGLSLVEVLIASLIATSIVATLYLFLFGSLQSFAVASVTQKTHAEFLVLREYLSRDIQQASALVEQVSLDGQTCWTRRGPLADSLVLRLPAVDTQGTALPGLYDFVVYSVQPSQGVASLSRQLFTTRNLNGHLMTPLQGSVRVPEAKVLVKELLSPQANGTVGPLFSLDRPIVAVSREVLLTITLQAAESTYTRHIFPQTYTVRFRLRNS